MQYLKAYDIPVDSHELTYHDDRLYFVQSDRLHIADADGVKVTNLRATDIVVYGKQLIVRCDHVTHVILEGEKPVALIRNKCNEYINIKVLGGRLCMEVMDYDDLDLVSLVRLVRARNKRLTFMPTIPFRDYYDITYDFPLKLPSYHIKSTSDEYPMYVDGSSLVGFHSDSLPVYADTLDGFKVGRAGDLLYFDAFGEALGVRRLNDKTFIVLDEKGGHHEDPAFLTEDEYRSDNMVGFRFSITGEYIISHQRNEKSVKLYRLGWSREFHRLMTNQTRSGIKQLMLYSHHSRGMLGRLPKDMIYEIAAYL